MPPGPPPAKVSCTFAVIAPSPPASETTNVVNARVPSPMTTIWPMSVATTLRRPPVAE